MKRYSMPSHMPDEFPFIDRKMWEKPMTDRESHRAAVEAGYASLAEYIKKWGDDKMNLPKRLREHDYEWSPQDAKALGAEAADEIERLWKALKDKDELIQYLEGHIDGLKKFVVQQKETE